MSGQIEQLTSGRLLARNTVWSLAGTGLPFLVAALVIPALIRGLGTERFGLLSIIWVVIGYFSVFDLGLSLALTQLVAERLGAGRAEDIPRFVKTALGMIGLLGIGAAALIASASPWIVGGILNASGDLRTDGIRAFLILALSLPFIILSGGLVGLLQAYQKFSAISSTSMVTGSLNFVGPLIVLHWTRSLTAAASAIAASRMLASAAYSWQFRRSFPSMWREGRFEVALLRPLMRFGSWFTVGNVIGPFMVYLDRFVIGALIGLTAVAYYATPYEVVTRLWVLPVAFVSVLFPAFTAALATDKERVKALFSRAYRVVVLAMLPPLALIVLFAPEGLSAWVGPSFAQHSVGVLRWLCIGVLVNSIARLPLALIQGAGRPDLVAKLYCIELPLYLVTLSFFLKAFGIEGAAIAWTLRAAADTLGLFWISGKVAPFIRALTVKAMILVTLSCVAMGLLTLAPDLDIKLALGATLLVGIIALGYREVRGMGLRLGATYFKALRSK